MIWGKTILAQSAERQEQNNSKYAGIREKNEEVIDSQARMIFTE